MPTFIKTGFWETTKVTAPKNWLNLTKLIKDNSGGTSGNYIPLTGTEEGKPIDGKLVFKSKESDVSMEFASDLNRTMYTEVQNLTNNRGGYSEVSFFGTEIGSWGSEEGDEVYLTTNLEGIKICDRKNKKGLEGEEDYSNNLTPLHYTQRSYVERPETLINCLNNTTPEQLSTIKSILGIV